MHHADCDFACTRLAPRSRLTGAIFACVIWAGSLFPRTNMHTQLAALGPVIIHVAWESVMWVLVCGHGV